ncbi:hypothetical protein INT48_009697 [Thamnidium elegans]|uniref:26S proteasome non-ATPase regulatory subunit 5 n=1 Tax=Thamnidium elegans TaxID=101142 RepID=A0A8H7W2Q7_9FUNG|nr:hypothetical protein INT48_009697 [Thamnidium elegans]
MSPALSNPLDQVSRVLAPNANVPLAEKVAVLQTFSTTLQGHVPMERSVQILSVIPLGLFYNGFSIEDDKLTSVLCELIQCILSPFSFDHIVSEENKSFLIQGLTHFTPEIRYLSVQQVFKCLASDEFVSIMVNSDIFPLVLATIAFQDTRTANKASELLYKMSAFPSGLEAFFGPTCTMMLSQLLRINGTISFRVYDLIIKVAAISDDTFSQCEASGLLKEFIKELESTDLLIKINAIELLNEIATTTAGLTFLEKAALLESISAVLDNPNDDDAVVALVKCAVIKFFGILGENKTGQFESMVTKYDIFSKLEKCLESSNEEIVIVTISSLGLIGSHIAGLELISKQQSLIETYFDLLESSIGHVKENEQLTLDLFNRIQGRPSTLNSLIKEAKQPEDSIRVASFALMQAVAYHAWGSQTWKYAIIQTMASAPDASHLFKEYYAQLVVYIRQGAYYKTLEPVAAVESS